jgi:hypothetical protein
MKWPIIPLLALSILFSCGDNSPFDEDYWGTPAEVRAEEDTTPQNYSATVNPLFADLEGLEGEVDITINQTDVQSRVSLSDIPQSLMIGQRSISNLSCETIAFTYPPPVITNTTLEFKDVDVVDNASRESLIAELNQADPNNGDSTNLVGKSYVVKAYIENFSAPAPFTNVLIPIACGTIE